MESVIVVQSFNHHWGAEMHALLKQNLYQDLLSLPESLTGEILNGRLYAQPRPSAKHVLVSSNLGIEIGGPYFRGRGGPGGWWILQEPEVHLALDEQVVVPDVAGWKKSRMPVMPEGHKFTVVPDWVCEVLSPSTESSDREIKKPLYARYGVRYLWLMHPKNQTLEAYKLVKGDWQLQGEFCENDKVCVEPFELLDITLGELFGG